LPVCIFPVENSVTTKEMETAAFMWFRFPVTMKKCDHDSEPTIYLTNIASPLPSASHKRKLK